MKWMLIACFAVSIACFGQTQTTNSVAEECAGPYQNTFLRYSSSSQLSVQVDAVERVACDGESSSFTAGFNSQTSTIINAFPAVSHLLGNMQITNNKAFCSQYKKNHFGLSTSNATVIEPVVEAMGQYNECILIARQSGVSLSSHYNDPQHVSISGKFNSNNGGRFGFTLATRSFKCTATDLVTGDSHPAGTSEVIMAHNFGISCVRPPSKRGADVGFTEDSISLNTSEGYNFSVRVPADTLYGVQSRRQAEQTFRQQQSQIDNLQTKLTATSEKLELDGAKLAGEHIVIWYFCEGTVSGAGTWFPCTDWYSKHPTPDVIAHERMCPNGTVINQVRIYTHPGGACGINTFVGICVPK